MVRLGEISTEVWDKVVEYMEWKLAEIKFEEEDLMFDWRKTANMFKLERELYEKYGN